MNKRGYSKLEWAKLYYDNCTKKDNEINQLKAIINNIYDMLKFETTHSAKVIVDVIKEYRGQ